MHHTNQEIQKKRSSHAYSRERDIKDTNKNEIQAVIGLLYLTGIKKSNHTNFHELYTDDGTGIEICRARGFTRGFCFYCPV